LGRARVLGGNGIEVHGGGRRLLLDPHKKHPGSIVSHAHMDHLTADSYMTRETHAIMKVRKPRSRGLPVEFLTNFEAEGFNVRLLPAGHVFGSAMVIVNDGEVLYTGDFNPQGGYTAGRAEPQKCDSLVVESTYGTPDSVMPRKDQTYKRIVEFVQEAPGQVVFGAYEFGKAQELMALFNANGIPVAVSDGIARISSIYNLHGCELKWERLDYRCDAKVAIANMTAVQEPHGEVKALLAKDGAKAAVATGMVMRFAYAGFEGRFPLSDHADFWDIMGFVKACAPERVYTTHGSDHELARQIESRLGIPAEPLECHRHVAH
jgi:Cft2 family RNA processing exonuclease